MKSYFLISLGLAAPVLSEITCGVAHGYDTGTNAFFFSGDGSLDTFDLCSAKCQATSECQSFAFGSNQCLLYAAPLDTVLRSQANSPFLFYDRNCADIRATSTFATTMAPTTASNPDATTATTPDGSAETTASGQSGGNNNSGGGNSESSGSSSNGDTSTASGSGTGSSGGGSGSNGSGQGQTGSSSGESADATGSATGTATASGSQGASASATGTRTGSAGSSSSETSSSSGSDESGEASAASSILTIHHAWWLAAPTLFCFFAL